MNGQKVRIFGRFISIVLMLSVLLASGSFSAISTASGPPDPTPTPGLTRPGRLPLSSSQASSVSSAPGYCPSYGGSTDYEYISNVTLTPNPDGTMKLVVQVYIANPTGCTAGEPCPEYDDSPEYVNAWIDWDGDKAWEPSERVMDKALTGYLAINYHGTMTAVSQFSPPSSVTNEPTWLRANLGWGYSGYDPNDPCEEYWAWGNVVDKQVHIAKPKIKDITVQGVVTTNNEPETGSRVRLGANIEVPTGYEVTKCSWAGSLTPGNGDPANNCHYEYTPATGPGPAANTYGEKKATLTITYKHTASGATGQVSKDHTYKVFFEKTGDDDGDSTPNWFEYWGDDGAVPGLNAADVKYDSTCDPGLICYGSFRHPPNDNIYLKDGAAQTKYAGGLSVPAGTNCPGGNFGGEQGIDAAASTLAHERRHKIIYHNWDSASSSSCGNPTGPWGDCPDSDDPNHPTKHDRPGDDLPDAYETTLGTDPNNVDSCDIATVKGVPSYTQYGDNEFNALRAGDGITGNANNDWANPGKQTTTAFALSAPPQGQGTEPGVKSGPAGPHAPYSGVSVVAATSLGSLTGNYSDMGGDTDGDGLYNSLKLSVGVQIDQPTTYYMVAWLENGSGMEIAWASTGATLGAGTHTLDLLFDGRVIRASGLDGPYNISRVELRVVDDDFLVDAADDVHTTAAYQHTDFDSPDVAFTGSFSDAGVDTNTDGLYDLLRINLGLDVQEAGTYTVTGELEGSDSIAVASTTASLSTGGQTVDLDFDGQLIFQHRKDGPYHLRKLRVEDASGNRIDLIYDAYTTSAYTYGQFQHGGTTIDATSYNDQGLDVDSDGDYDYLLVEFQVNVDQEGTYRLLAALNDDEGETIASIIQDLDLLVGADLISLGFPGGAIYEHGIDGPYQVASVTLLDAAGTIVDYQQAAHTTQAYSHTDFSPPLISLAGGYQDYVRDTDGDGLYDYLSIDVSVIPGDAGVIIAQGRLVDSTEQEIGWVENSRQMNEGIAQIITLSFNGGLILASGRNGPFELRDLHIYHTGDPGQGVFVSQAHTTAAYSYLDFEEAFIMMSYLPIVMREYGATGDTYEPNDTPSQAYGPLSPGVTYQSYIWTEDDTDAYWINITHLNSINVSLTNIPVGCDYDLSLYDESLNEVDWSWNGGNADEYISYAPSSTGKYYIVVFQYEGYSTTQPYHLRAGFNGVTSMQEPFSGISEPGDIQEKQRELPMEWQSH